MIADEKRSAICVLFPEKLFWSMMIDGGERVQGVYLISERWTKRVPVYYHLNALFCSSSNYCTSRSDQRWQSSDQRRGLDHAPDKVFNRGSPTIGIDSRLGFAVQRSGIIFIARSCPGSNSSRPLWVVMKYTWSGFFPESTRYSWYLNREPKLRLAGNRS